MVECPICSNDVSEADINRHLDQHLEPEANRETKPVQGKAPSFAGFFQTPAAKQQPKPSGSKAPPPHPSPSATTRAIGATSATQQTNGTKRSFDDGPAIEAPQTEDSVNAAKRLRSTNVQKAAPLAERMRPRTLDEVYGQELVGKSGVIRGLIEENRIPSMILWGGTGVGKTTIARLIAQQSGCRFVEINSTSSNVAECKKLFAEARNELALSGRKTIIFCDELHRFSKSQQDVFLPVVEAGQITLIGATTENPSFKVVNPLLSRCRVFTLSKLTDNDIVAIMQRAIAKECAESPALLDGEFLTYLAAFSDGDARTALNLLEIALDLTKRPSMTKEDLKKSLTQTLVYDRNSDMHYDSISAFHKSVRGSDPDATLYYLARMLQSGEDPLYIARRMLVIASEDVGLADNTLLPLVTAAYTCAEKVGMPEARINLAHAAVALALAPKSTRVYRSLSNAMAALAEPGIAGLPIPLHIRNAPTRLMKEIGYGKEYKYNPDYVDGQVAQTYLPEKLIGRRFLEERDLGVLVDPDLEEVANST